MLIWNLSVCHVAIVTVNHVMRKVIAQNVKKASASKITNADNVTLQSACNVTSQAVVVTIVREAIGSCTKQVAVKNVNLDAMVVKVCQLALNVILICTL